MKVRDVMSAGPKTCMPETSLAEAASLMWENDCGALPVMGVEGTVVGMITDRDICFGMTTKNLAPSEVSVAEVITGRVFACSPDDDGALEGVVSMNDVVLRAEQKSQGRAPELSYGDVVETYKAICSHALLPQVARQPDAQAAARA